MFEFVRFLNNLRIFHLGLKEFDDFDEWILFSDRSVLLSEGVSKGTVLAEEFFIRNIGRKENKPVVAAVSKGTVPLSLSPLLLDSTSTSTTLFTDDIFSENFSSFRETPKQQRKPALLLGFLSGAFAMEGRKEQSAWRTLNRRERLATWGRYNYIIMTIYFYKPKLILNYLNTNRFLIFKF